MHQTNPDTQVQHAPVRDAGIRRAAWIAAISALLMLLVVVASAQIRVAGGIDVQPVRTAHRIAASTVALLVIALLAVSWRKPHLRAMSVVAFVLMLALSAVGWITGTTPPPAAAFFNQFGGLALTALLAWLSARAGGMAGAPGSQPLARVAFAFALAQAGFGSAIAAFAPAAPVIVLIAHASCGLAAAAMLAALRHPAFIACAVFAPAAGLAATLPGAHALVPVVHALSAALLVAAAAAAHGRSAYRGTALNTYQGPHRATPQ